MRKVVRLSVILAASLALFPCLASGEDKEEGPNFSISPPPIAYPYFTPGRKDGRIGAVYLDMKFENIGITGGGVDFIFRQASDRTFAFDIEGGLSMMFSNDLPLSPMYDPQVRDDKSSTWGDYDSVMVTADKADTTYYNIPLSLNLEVQAVNVPEFSLIVFAGPNVNLMWGSTLGLGGYTTRTDTNMNGHFVTLVPSADSFEQKMSVIMFGLQGGLQGGIPLGPFKLAPFFTARGTSGGSMTMTTTSMYKNVDPPDPASYDVPSSMATSLGMDIIFEPWGLSIGAVLQQIAANKQENNQKTMLITGGYHWVDRNAPQPASERVGARSGSMKKSALVAAAPVEPAPAAMETVTLAVAELENQNVGKGDAAIIADMLRSELVKTGAFTVVERRQMDKITAEQGFQQTGCTGDECAVKLGKLLNVRKIVVGSYGKLMESFVLNLRLVDVETGKVTYADTGKAQNADEGTQIIKEMAAKMAEPEGARKQ